MNTERPLHTMSPQEFGVCMQAAKARALALRQEAISELWSHLNAGVHRLWQALGLAVQEARRNTNGLKSRAPL